MQRQKNWCLLCLLCIGFTGCASVTNYSREHKFENRVRLFSQAIRWGEFERVPGYLRKREGQVQNQDLDSLNKIKVTKYLSTNKTLQENSDEQVSEIILVYEIDYYIRDEYKMKHLRYEQLWWYDEEAENWFLDSDLPKFEQ